jgi:aminomethyltransferase
MVKSVARKTPLHAEHIAAGGKLVEFAGFEMPIQYPAGIMREHIHTRTSAGLFDVSHMGQAFLIAESRSHQTVAEALERLVPADILNLKPGQQRYTQLLNESGGILDDLMVSRAADDLEQGTLTLVVNAACKETDYDHIDRNLPAGVKLVPRDDRALIALQGPLAVDVLEGISSGLSNLSFMEVVATNVADLPVVVSRSGYTGEDGFEISVDAKDAATLWRALYKDNRVLPIGLGARDSLRLESGLCLYGHDIDETTSPIEAALAWSIQKRRRELANFPGAARLKKELADGPSRVRVGLKPEGRAPVRSGTPIFVKENDKSAIGVVTSGGFGPSVEHPVAMGYVSKDLSGKGTKLYAEVRGRRLPISVTSLPFVPNNFKR